jgi:leucyl-tRNA synthetase
MCGKAIIVGRIEKMSKSKKNVVDPNVLLEKYGADTTRLFCLFAAPPERDLEWSEQGVDGGYRFLNRVWRFFSKWIPSIEGVQPFDGSTDRLDEAAKDLNRKIHQTIKRVSKDIENRFHFNTAISGVMELFNAMSAFDPEGQPRETLAVMRLSMDTVVLLLSPIVPHFSEELWQALGHDHSVLQETWPNYTESALVKDELLIVIQVNGKLRSRFTIDASADDETIKNRALSDERVQKFIEGQSIRKTIVVKKKLVNIVV